MKDHIPHLLVDRMPALQKCYDNLLRSDDSTEREAQPNKSLSRLEDYQVSRVEDLRPDNYRFFESSCDRLRKSIEFGGEAAEFDKSFSGASDGVWRSADTPLWRCGGFVESYRELADSRGKSGNTSLAGLQDNAFGNVNDKNSWSGTLPLQTSPSFLEREAPTDECSPEYSDQDDNDNAPGFEIYWSTTDERNCQEKDNTVSKYVILSSFSVP